MTPNSRLAFKPRRPAFDFSATPLHWMPKDPQLTHTVNVLHLLLPAGERWFLKVFKEAMPYVKDQNLRTRMKAFMGQEEIHGRTHQLAVEHFAKQGLDATAFLADLDSLFTTLQEPRPFGQRWWLVRRLSIIAAIEHLTCVLANFMWEAQARWLSEGADPEMVRCLQWHASEEIEHRRVAFEVARALGAGTTDRAMAMAVVFPVLTGIWMKGTATLMRADPTQPGPATWTRFMKHGLAGELPPFSSLVANVGRYLSPGHDPHDENQAWPQARAFLEGFERRSPA